MTDLFVLPDAEALVSQFLRSRDDVTDDVEQRVFGVIPENDDAAQPLIRISQFDSISRVEGWLDGALLQIEGYAAAPGHDLATKAVASRVTRRARAALGQLAGAVDDGVVTGVATSGLRYDPDPTFKPARHRYIFTATIHAHPIPTIGS